MTAKVFATFVDRFDVLCSQLILGHAAVHLERTGGRHQHYGGRFQTGLAALDIEEFLGAEIRTETGFGDHVVGQLERGSGSHD